MKLFNKVDDLTAAFDEVGYFADQGLSTALFLSQKLETPILLEGEPGVGKTEVAKVLAKIHNLELVRLQCYEGLDVYQAVYDWNYAKQLLSIKVHDANKNKIVEEDLYNDKFLIARPLLKAIQGDKPKVLLIDEIDRSDVAFEAFLLELLSDFQITIPEIGTIKAAHKPLVVITSNRKREIHDALKRRCLYHWIDYPSFDKELQILKTNFPTLDEEIVIQATKILQNLRKLDLEKKPGIAESISWLEGFISMGGGDIFPKYFDQSLSILLKSQIDQSLVISKKLDLQ